MSKFKIPQWAQPLIMAVFIAIGIVIGIWYAPSGRSGGSLFDQVVELIKYDYVDTVNLKKIQQEAIAEMLHELDPHSSFIAAEDLQSVNEPLEGSFDGIGVEFTLDHDTIFIVNVIEGGPSADLGLQSGDRIIEIDSEKVAGKGIDNDGVIKRLKGPKGTIVRVKVVRRGVAKPILYTITRGTIPIYSVDAAYMADNTTGYIKLSRFGETTVEEFERALDELKTYGAKKLIVDLRDNGGGYLNAAVSLADLFLDDDKLVVYTKGRNASSEKFNATKPGPFETGRIVILINENSASASEILTGALQDWDRALVLGRRSFGKGLVQNSFMLKDGSAVRLTTSRYYTPSGRSIQRPYTKGYETYESDYNNRFHSGEMFTADSMKKDEKLKFKTAGGRPVYGGGGIIPDVFVPLDTSNNSNYFTELQANGLIRSYAYELVDRKATTLKKYSSKELFHSNYNVEDDVLISFFEFAKIAGVMPTNGDFSTSRELIRNHLKMNMARKLFGNTALYYEYNFQDKTFLKALELLSTGNEHYWQGIK